MCNLHYSIILLLFLTACSSGKASLSHGNFYDAALESINRLRAKPNHKKAKLVLTQSYPLAVELIEKGIQNDIRSNDSRKWRNAVAGYQKINQLNDEIKTSLGALMIVPNPVTKYEELAHAKSQAAEESYQSGIQAMMKPTRDDAKNAYFSFKEADSYQPGYREVIEMMNQAESNATLHVAYREINTSTVNYGTIQPIIQSIKRQFLSFKPEDEKEGTPPHQLLQFVYKNFYIDDRPIISSNTEKIQKSIKVGEKKNATGASEDVFETVKADITYYVKIKNASSNANLKITEINSRAILLDINIKGNVEWKYTWATYQGDARALNSTQLNLTKQKESYPNDRDLYTESINRMNQNLEKELQNFYKKY